MPDGWVHQNATISVATTLATTALLQAVGINHEWAHTAQIAGGSLIGIVLSPDLDIDKGFLAFKEMERTVPVLGWLVSKTFRLYWMPYSLAIPHRATFSHGPILSTLIRLVYLSPLIGVLTYFGQLAAWDWFGFSLWDYVVADPWRFWSAIIRIVIGLILADTCHFALDWAHGQHGKENRDGY